MLRSFALAVLLLLVACDAEDTVSDPLDEYRIPRIESDEPPSPVSARYLASVQAEPGPADRAGRWLQTNAVEMPSQGWVADLETGRSIRLLLLPQDAQDADLDLISIEALAALGVNSPRILVLDVYRDVRALPN